MMLSSSDIILILFLPFLFFQYKLNIKWWTCKTTRSVSPKNERKWGRFKAPTARNRVKALLTSCRENTFILSNNSFWIWTYNCFHWDIHLGQK